MPVGLTALLLAPAVFAQVAVPAGALASVAEAQDRVRRGLAAVKADPELFARLVDTLQREGEPGGAESDPTLSLEGPAFGGAAGETVRAVLHGGEPEPRELGAEGSGYIDLTLRFVYTQLEGIQTSARELDDGATEIDSWHFTLDAAGSIWSALHMVLVFVPTQDGSDAALDKERTRVVRFNPRDPRVAARWKGLEKKLAQLRRSFQL